MLVILIKPSECIRKKQNLLLEGMVRGGDMAERRQDAGTAFL